MKKLKQRWNSKTPQFWKKVQRIAILVGAVAGTIIAAPIALPAAVITVAGYAVAVGTAVATVSQFTVEDAPTNTEENVNN
jgi:ABC-type xylose transport system permease subunit